MCIIRTRFNNLIRLTLPHEKGASQRWGCPIVGRTSFRKITVFLREWYNSARVFSPNYINFMTKRWTMTPPTISFMFSSEDLFMFKQDSKQSRSHKAMESFMTNRGIIRMSTVCCLGFQPDVPSVVWTQLKKNASDASLSDLDCRSLISPISRTPISKASKVAPFAKDQEPCLRRKLFYQVILVITATSKLALWRPRNILKGLHASNFGAQKSG